MGKLLLEGMEFFAYHGHYHEERIIGSKFIVDLELEYDSFPAQQDDHLRDALNYQEVYQVVKKEMDQKSHLLENVAHRILKAVRKAFPAIRAMTVKISKINPTVGGKVRQVSCILSE